MADVTIRISTDSSGAVTGIQQVGQELGKLDNVASSSGKGIASAGAGVLDFAKNAMALGAALGGAGAVIDHVNEIGVASLRARAGLDAMTNSHADEFVNKMMVSTRGLVDDTDLMQKATFALSAGVVTTSDGMAKLAEDGAALGRVFGGDAAGGIDKLTQAMQMVGQTRALRPLGIDVSYVKDEFERLKSTMGDEGAWRFAVMEGADQTVKKLGDAAYGTGTALERLKTQAADAFEQFSERAAQGLEGMITGVQNLGAAYDDLGKKEAARRAEAGTVLSTDLLPQEVKNLNASGDMRTAQVNNANALFNADAAQGLSSADFPKAPNMVTSNQFASLMPSNAPNPYDAQIKAAIEREHAFMDASEEARVVAEWGRALDPVKTKVRDIEIDTGHVITNAYQAAAGAGELSHAYQTGHSWLMQQVAGAQRLLQPMQEQVQYANDHNGVTKKTEEGLRQLGTIGSSVWSQLTAGAQRYLEPLAKAAELTRQQAEVEKQSVSQRFGIQGNNLASEVGGGMEGAIQQRRSQLSKKDQDTFDKQAQKALDDYALATGQATKASLMFRDMQAGITKQFVSGKISVAQYSSEVLGLERNLRDGATSAEQLAKVQMQLNMTNAKGSTKSAMLHGLRADAAESNLEGAAGANANDPYGPAAKSADKYTTSVQKIGPAANTAGVQAAAGAAILGGAMALANGPVSAVLGTVQRLVGALNSINGKTFYATVAIKGASSVGLAPN